MRLIISLATAIVLLGCTTSPSDHMAKLAGQKEALDCQAYIHDYNDPETRWVGQVNSDAEIRSYCADVQATLAKLGDK